MRLEIPSERAQRGVRRCARPQSRLGSVAEAAGAKSIAHTSCARPVVEPHQVGEHRDARRELLDLRTVLPRRALQRHELLDEGLNLAPQLACPRLLHLAQALKQQLMPLGRPLQLFAVLRRSAHQPVARAHPRLQRLQPRATVFDGHARLAVLRPVRGVLNSAGARERGVPLLQPRQLGAQLGHQPPRLEPRLLRPLDALLQEGLLRAQHGHVLELRRVLARHAARILLRAGQQRDLGLERRELPRRRLRLELRRAETLLRRLLRVVAELPQPAGRRRQLLVELLDRGAQQLVIGLQLADQLPALPAFRAQRLDLALERHKVGLCHLRARSGQPRARVRLLLRLTACRRTRQARRPGAHPASVAHAPRRRR
mmetsp:Transcript_74621/g.198529  ORF Transcript_74621/g.198529 Transcript_74621/m.198529 type:complete len:371 (+) Transcript_74621:414-1526(+)